jgi:5'-3' exonuclease
MGIKNLHQFLKRACPTLYSEIHLSRYAYKKIAIDTSIYMCKFKTTYGKQWLDAFLQLIAILRENEIHPIFVYDTKFPIEKEEEKKNRTLARLKTKERVEKIFTDWEAYKAGYAHDTTYFTQHQPRPLPLAFSDMSRELAEYIQSKHPDKTEMCVAEIDCDIDHLLNTLLSIRTEDFDTTRELFTILQVPWINAPGEAEATCSVLCREGYVDAVLSEDTDVLNYRAPIFLHRLNIMSQTVVEISYIDILLRLGLSSEQFLDFCIMCGTDYNSNLFKIGPEKSYRLLKRHGSIEQIRIHNPSIDMSSFPFERVREIFLDDQKIPSSHIEELCYSGIPDTNRLFEFCFHHNCRFDIARLYRAFTVNPNVVFPDD